MDWYLGVLKTYAQFSGRARRKEYWMFFLINVIIGLVLGVVDGVTGMVGPSGVGVSGGMYALAILIPGIAVVVRRLHDTGRTGWWLLIGFVPLIGVIVRIVFLVDCLSQIASATARETRAGGCDLAETVH